MYLTCATAGDDGVVLDRPLDDHDGVVQTSLYLGNELLRASSEDERARLGCGAGAEDVAVRKVSAPISLRPKVPEEGIIHTV